MRHPAAPTLRSSFLVLRLLLESTHQGTVRAGLTPLKQGAYRMMQWYSQRISNQLRVSCAFPTILTHVIAFLHIRLTLGQTMIWCSRMRCSSDNKTSENYEAEWLSGTHALQPLGYTMRGRHAYYRLCKMMAKSSPPPYIVLAVPATNGIWLMMRQEDL